MNERRSEDDPSFSLKFGQVWNHVKVIRGPETRCILGILWFGSHLVKVPEAFGTIAPMNYIPRHDSRTARVGWQELQYGRPAGPPLTSSSPRSSQPLRLHRPPLLHAALSGTFSPENGLISCVCNPEPEHWISSTQGRVRDDSTVETTVTALHCLPPLLKLDPPCLGRRN